jgi:hypothetical protein
MQDSNDEVNLAITDSHQMKRDNKEASCPQAKTRIHIR